MGCFPRQLLDCVPPRLPSLHTLRVPTLLAGVNVITLSAHWLRSLSALRTVEFPHTRHYLAVLDSLARHNTGLR